MRPAHVAGSAAVVAESAFIGRVLLKLLRINRAVKKLMHDYIFRFVSKVCFHVGSKNLRSQSAGSARRKWESKPLAITEKRQKQRCLLHRTDAGKSAVTIYSGAGTLV
jgi:hypothetical protein